MADIVQRLAHSGDVTGYAGGGLIVSKEHRLDPVALVRCERRLIALDRRALAPFRLQNLDFEAEALSHVDPEVAEHAEPRGDDLVSGRQCVG